MGAYGPGGESAAHKLLKLYVAGHPLEFGLTSAAVPHIEYPFATGDRVDVMFENHMPDCAQGAVMAPSAWQLLLGLDAWQVTQISRRPQRLQPDGTEDGGDLLAGQRAAALSAAYHGGAGPVGFAWVRDRAGGPVQVQIDYECP